MKTFDLYKYGKNHLIQLQVCMYPEGNLAVVMTTWEDGFPEPWNTLTVNLDCIRERDCAYIDTKNNGQDILTWITTNNLGAPTGHLLQSGYCMYPEYRFRPRTLEEIDDEGYATYLNARKADSLDER